MKDLRFIIQDLRKKLLKKENNYSKPGFTLIELLIVVAIIGVLATLLLVNFIGVRQRARDGKRKSDISQIQAALEQYRSDAGSYPTQLYPASPNADGTYSLTNNGVTYMKSIPIDPLGTGAGYGTNGLYYYYSDGSSYWVVGCLENTSDNQGVSPSTATFTASGATDACTYNTGSNKYYVATNP